MTKTSGISIVRVAALHGLAVAVPALLTGCSSAPSDSCSETLTCAPAADGGADAAVEGAVSDTGGADSASSGDSNVATTDSSAGHDGATGCTAPTSLDCSGTCVDPTLPAHCGTCTNVCGGPDAGSGAATCTAGVCGVGCSGGTSLDCNGACSTRARPRTAARAATSVPGRLREPARRSARSRRTVVAFAASAVRALPRCCAGARASTRRTPTTVGLARTRARSLPTGRLRAPARRSAGSRAVAPTTRAVGRRAIRIRTCRRTRATRASSTSSSGSSCHRRAATRTPGRRWRRC